MFEVKFIEIVQERLETLQRQGKIDQELHPEATAAALNGTGSNRRSS